MFTVAHKEWGEFTTHDGVFVVISLFHNTLSVKQSTENSPKNGEKERIDLGMCDDLSKGLIIRYRPSIFYKKSVMI